MQANECKMKINARAFSLTRRRIKKINVKIAEPFKAKGKQDGSVTCIFHREFKSILNCTQKPRWKDFRTKNWTHPKAKKKVKDVFRLCVCVCEFFLFTKLNVIKMSRFSLKGTPESSKEKCCLARTMASHATASICCGNISSSLLTRLFTSSHRQLNVWRRRNAMQDPTQLINRNTRVHGEWITCPTQTYS